LEVPEARGNVFGGCVLWWILRQACGREESRLAPSQFTELRDEPTTPGDFAQIIPVAAVNFVASEVAYLPPFTGKKIVSVSIGKSFAATCPKPIDCA
jgi:hypothetical protein